MNWIEELQMTEAVTSGSGEAVIAYEESVSHRSRETSRSGGSVLFRTKHLGYTINTNGLSRLKLGVACGEL